MEKFKADGVTMVMFYGASPGFWISSPGEKVRGTLLSTDTLLHLVSFMEPTAAR